MPSNITESDTFSAVLQTPNAGEAASASGLLGLFLQPASNRLRWLFNRINTFVVGGTLTPSNDLTINTPTTKLTHVNGTSFASAADGGDVTAPGNVTAVGDLIGAASQVTGNAIVGGALGVSGQASAGSMQSSGPVSFISAGRVVPRVHTQVGAAGMTASVATASRYFYPSAAASSSVQIDATGAVEGDTFTFTTAETTNTISINNPSATPIFSIVDTTGNARGVEVTLLSGVWTVTNAFSAHFA